MRIIFAGTPTFAAESLRALIHSRHSVIATYTAPDKPSGRGLKLHASAVKQVANEFDIPVFQPTSFKSDAVLSEFSDLNPDLFLVAAYGFILPESILSIPRYGSVNIHASLLPRWRGAAPIQRCILAGDSHSGITLMQMDAGLDTGDILKQESFALSPEETAQSLHDKLSTLANAMLIPFLDDLENQKIKPQAQNASLATYAKKISKSEALIDFNLTAQDFDCAVRGFFPVPTACVSFQNQLLKILSAKPIDNKNNFTPGTIFHIDNHSLHIACKEGGIQLFTVQLPNKNPTTGGEFARQFHSICNIGSRFE